MMTGGIAAIQNGGEISYCLSNGIITDCRHNPDTTCRNASNYVGGISGWMTSGSIKGCLNLSTITAMNCGGIVGVTTKENNIQNCYYLAGCATSVSNDVTVIRNGMSSTSSDTPDDIIGCTTAADAELLASGEVTYHLNGDQSVIIWKQTIREDPLPAFDGDEVYYDSALDKYINHEHIWEITKNGEVISAVVQIIAFTPTQRPCGYPPRNLSRLTEASRR